MCFECLFVTVNAIIYLIPKEWLSCHPNCPTERCTETEKNASCQRENRGKYISRYRSSEVRYEGLGFYLYNVCLIFIFDALWQRKCSAKGFCFECVLVVLVGCYQHFTQQSCWKFTVVVWLLHFFGKTPSGCRLIPAAVVWGRAGSHACPLMENNGVKHGTIHHLIETSSGVLHN